MKYREANVWIIARRLGMPVGIAETLTEYLSGTKIPRGLNNLPENRNWNPVTFCIEAHLSGNAESDPYVIERGFLPYRTYEVKEEGRRTRCLFYEITKNEWRLTQWHLQGQVYCEFEYLAETDATLPEFWRRFLRIEESQLALFIPYNLVSCAHVEELDENFRIVFFKLRIS